MFLQYDGIKESYLSKGCQSVFFFNEQAYRSRDMELATVRLHIQTHVFCEQAGVFCKFEVFDR